MRLFLLSLLICASLSLSFAQISSLLDPILADNGGPPQHML